MLQLRKSGHVVEVGDSDKIMPEFERQIARWNDEQSGWGADGAFWSVTELPDVSEYQASEETTEDDVRVRPYSAASVVFMKKPEPPEVPCEANGDVQPNVCDEDAAVVLFKLLRGDLNAQGSRPVMVEQAFNMLQITFDDGRVMRMRARWHESDPTRVDGLEVVRKVGPFALTAPHAHEITLTHGTLKGFVAMLDGDKRKCFAGHDQMEAVGTLMLMRHEELGVMFVDKTQEKGGSR